MPSCPAKRYMRNIYFLLLFWIGIFLLFFKGFYILPHFTEGFPTQPPVAVADVLPDHPPVDDVQPQPCDEVHIPHRPSLCQRHASVSWAVYAGKKKVLWAVLCKKREKRNRPSRPRAEERGRRQSCVHTCFCLPSLVPFTSPRVRERQRQQLGWPPPPPAAQLPRASSSSGPLPATTTTTTRTHHHSMPAPSLPFPSLPYLPCKIEHPNPKWSYYLATCMPIWSNRKCIHVLWRLTSIWCTCVHSCPSLGPPCTCFFILYAFRHALISTVEHKGYKYDFLLVLFCLRQFMFRLL